MKRMNGIGKFSLFMIGVYIAALVMIKLVPALKNRAEHPPEMGGAGGMGGQMCVDDSVGGSDGM